MAPRANGLSDQDFENIRRAELCDVAYNPAVFYCSPSPLHLACMISHLGIIKLLLGNGASYDASDARSRNPRDYFDPEAGDISCLKEYDSMQETWENRILSLQTLSERAESAFQMFRKGRFERLHRFVLRLLQSRLLGLKRRPSPLVRLLEDYPDVRIERSTHGWTLLHLAVQKQKTGLVQQLIASDEDRKYVSAQDRWRCSSEIRSAWFGDARHLTTINDATALHYACLIGDVTLVRMLLEAGADWTVADSKGRKPEDYIFDTRFGALKKGFTLLCSQCSQPKGAPGALDAEESSSESSDSDSPFRLFGRPRKDRRKRRSIR